MKIGDWVRVVGRTSYSGNYQGCTGVIETIYQDKHIAVRLDGHCSYACFDEDILIKDYVVVKTAHHGIAVAQVVGFRDMKCDYDREIIAKFDMAKFMERVEKRTVAAELKEKMERRAAELQGLELYTTLAAYDKEMASLLDKYKEATT